MWPISLVWWRTLCVDDLKGDGMTMNNERRYRLSWKVVAGMIAETLSAGGCRKLCEMVVDTVREAIAPVKESSSGEAVGKMVAAEPEFKPIDPMEGAPEWARRTKGGLHRGGRSDDEFRRHLLWEMSHGDDIRIVRQLSSHRDRGRRD